MSAPIRLILITGYLGVGKTTLLKKLLAAEAGGRTGVIVNEFASVGVDGVTLRGAEGVQLVEINNGSIFCACLKAGFVRTLKAFSAQQIDTLYVEASGLAEPASMQALLSGLAPYLEHPYDYRGAVCVVDAADFSELAETLVPLCEQVRAADLLLVNKTDLIDKAALSALHEALRALNPAAPMYDTSYGGMPRAALEDLTRRADTQGETRTGARPYACTLFCDTEQTAGALLAFLQAAAPYTNRIKGYMRTSGGWLHADAVRKRILVEPASRGDAPERGALACIGTDGRDLGALLCALWADCCAGDCTLREAHGSALS